MKGYCSGEQQCACVRRRRILVTYGHVTWCEFRSFALFTNSGFTSPRRESAWLALGASLISMQLHSQQIATP